MRKRGSALKIVQSQGLRRIARLWMPLRGLQSTAKGSSFVKRRRKFMSIDSARYLTTTRSVKDGENRVLSAGVQQPTERTGVVLRQKERLSSARHSLFCVHFYISIPLSGPSLKEFLDPPLLSCVCNALGSVPVISSGLCQPETFLLKARDSNPRSSSSDLIVPKPSPNVDRQRTRRDADHCE